MSDQNLPEAAQPVWQAYQAMAESKQKHLNFLHFLEDKYPKYGQPSAEENAELKDLLAAHDTRVNAFKSALIQLRISDPDAYGALIQRLSRNTDV